MLDTALELQHQYENSTDAAHRKQKGQIFTPRAIARYMAGLFSAIPDEYCVLEPGAGVGILTAAFCERLLRLRSARHLTAHLFENDSQITPLLRRNLDNCRRVLNEAGHCFDYIIHDNDFIVETSHGLDGQCIFDDDRFNVRFDGVIMNPPYFKLRKDSVYARLMSRVVHGQPNIYAFFLTLATRLLRENGELVAITPRSFCNGLYFRGFRRWYFDRVALDHIHLFESRTEAFKHSSVLQENIITKVHRLGRPSPRITVTTSIGRNLDDGLQRTEMPSESIVDNSCGDYIIRIPESLDDRDVMKLVESFATRFTDIGLRISTGPVVMFRATEFLMYDAREKGSVPLLLPHNVKPFETVWPLSKNGKPVAFKLCEDALHLLLPVKNYVLLKRFSAKEEKRRLTAGCFFRLQHSFSRVGIENHLNYVSHAGRELSEDETYGVAALLNSVLFDRYFRTISGNTQVNATEIRTMGFPDLKTLSKIGRQVKRKTPETEAIVFSELGVDPSLRQCLVGK